VATAREKLYDEIVALTSSALPDDAEAVIKKIMVRYRVQTKPGINIPAGMTARDALGERLLKLWSSPPKDLAATVGTTIDEFRMQLKQKGGSTGAKKKKAPAKPKAAPRSAAPAPAPTPTPAGADTAKPAQAAGDRRRLEPVAGGPRRRGKTRGECPKCHSKGVVLARSYAGDEYFSCIYCGWQAYKPADENDPTASLAVRLLGQSANEN
jgi:hypothetical protein